MVDTADSKIPCGTTEVHASRLCTNALTKDSKRGRGNQDEGTRVEPAGAPCREVDQQ